MTVDRTRAEAIVYEVFQDAPDEGYEPLEFSMRIVEALHRARMISHEKEPISHWRTITQEGEVIAGSEHEHIARYWQKNHPGENIVQRQWVDKHSFEWRDEIAIEAEQAVDPVEARALELFHLAYPGEYALTGSMETCRRIAEAEARQEADQ